MNYAEKLLDLEACSVLSRATLYGFSPNFEKSLADNVNSAIDKLSKGVVEYKTLWDKPKLGEVHHDIHGFKTICVSDERVGNTTGLGVSLITGDLCMYVFPKD